MLGNQSRKAETCGLTAQRRLELQYPGFRWPQILEVQAGRRRNVGGGRGFEVLGHPETGCPIAGTSCPLSCFDLELFQQAVSSGLLLFRPSLSPEELHKTAYGDNGSPGHSRFQRPLDNDRSESVSDVVGEGAAYIAI